MSYGKKYAGMGTFDEVVNGRSKPAPGMLKCHGCYREYDPRKSAIRRRPIHPAAFCNSCLDAHFDAGRWQERFAYEAAGE